MSEFPSSIHGGIFGGKISFILRQVLNLELLLQVGIPPKQFCFTCRSPVLD